MAVLFVIFPAAENGVHRATCIYCNKTKQKIVSQNTGVLKHWSSETLEFWKFPLEFWNTGVPKHWSSETLEFWNTGVLKHWSSETLEFWNTGVLKHWSFKTIDSTTKMVQNLLNLGQNAVLVLYSLPLHLHPWHELRTAHQIYFYRLEHTWLSDVYAPIQDMHVSVRISCTASFSCVWYTTTRDRYKTYRRSLNHYLFLPISATWSGHKVIRTVLMQLLVLPVVMVTKSIMAAGWSHRDGTCGISIFGFQ